MNDQWVRWLPSTLGRRLSGRRGLQAIVANTGWLFFDTFVRLGIGFLVGVKVARYLGPGRYGTLNFASALVALFASVASLGLNSILVRDLVRYPEKRDDLIGSAFRLKLIGGVSAFVLGQVCVFVLRPTDTVSQLLVAIIASSLIFQAMDVVDSWLQSKVESRFAVYARNVAVLVAAAVKVALIIGRASLVAFAWATMVEAVVAAIGFGVVAKLRLPSRWYRSGTWPLMRGLLKESWPLMFSGIAIMLYMRIDQIMLAQMIGASEVGIYSAALRISEIWYVIPTAIVISVAPSLTEARERSQQLYQERFEQVVRNLAIVAYGVALLVFASGQKIVVLLYGQSFASAGPILTVHVWAAVFVFVGVAGTPWVLNEGLTRIALYRTALGALINILLNVVLIPKYGGLGAATATIISQAISAWISNLFFGPASRHLFYVQTRALSLGILKPSRWQR
ncbi:MAG: flippase [Gemmatimonadaceae bacterium]